MFTPFIQYYKKWLYVFRHQVFDAKTSLKRYLLAEYALRDTEAKVLRALVNDFVQEGLPVLATKLKAELGQERFQKECKPMRLFWLEHYLAWAHAGKAPITFKFYVVEQLYFCAERERYRSLPWEEVVRNVPAACWLSYYGVNAPTFLHLATGSNIRRHPDYGHFTRKMAHVYHTATAVDYVRQPNGMATLLMTLGCEAPVWPICNALRQCVDWPYQHKAFRATIPLAERLLAFYQAGLTDEASWYKINMFLQRNWKQRYKQIMQLNTAAKFTAAVERFMTELEAHIHLDELMAEHEYTTNEEWPVGQLGEWNQYQTEGWYKIIELRSAAELVLEGARMHHCVGGYVEECLDEGCHIYSLRFRACGKSKWRSVVTMAICDRTIIEMQAVLNTEVEDRHLELIRCWLRQYDGKIALES